MSIESLLERIATALEVGRNGIDPRITPPAPAIPVPPSIIGMDGGYVRLSVAGASSLQAGGCAVYLMDCMPIALTLPAEHVDSAVPLYARLSDLAEDAAATPMPEGQAQVSAGLLGKAEPGAALGAAFGKAAESGAALGAMGTQAQAQAQAAKRGPGRPRKADPAPDAAPGGQPQAEAPKQQAEAPKQQAEAPKQQAEAPKQQAEAPKPQAEAVKPQIQVRADAPKPQVQPAPEPQATQPHLMDVARKGDIPLSPTLPADGNIDVSTLRLRLSRLSSLGLRARLEDMFGRFGITVLSQLNAAEYPRMWDELDALQAEYEDNLRQQGGFTR